jgi:hypothetical protein
VWNVVCDGRWVGVSRDDGDGTVTAIATPPQTATETDTPPQTVTETATPPQTASATAPLLDPIQTEYSTATAPRPHSTTPQTATATAQHRASSSPASVSTLSTARAHLPRALRARQRFGGIARNPLIVSDLEHFLVPRQTTGSAPAPAGYGIRQDAICWRPEPGSVRAQVRTDSQVGRRQWGRLRLPDSPQSRPNTRLTTRSPWNSTENRTVPDLIVYKNSFANLYKYERPWYDIA